MRKFIVAFLLCMAAMQALWSQATSSDVASVDGIVKALYEVISGPAGQARDWDRFRTLLHKDARLTPIYPLKAGGNGAHFYTVDEFVEAASRNVAEEGFFEQEIGRRTEQFGDLVHCFSSYASFHSLEDKEPFERGVNSIQLMHDGTRWWILNITWQGESDGRKLPRKYLRK